MSSTREQIRGAVSRMPGFDLETYRAKHRNYRGRMADGRRNYLELCPETGATVLVVETLPESDDDAAWDIPETRTHTVEQVGR